MLGHIIFQMQFGKSICKDKHYIIKIVDIIG